MFKGIIPGKRTASIDFQIVSPLSDSHGKENEPNPPYVQIPVPSATRVASKPKTDKSKTKKSSASTAMVSEHPAEMEQAFDKLLVSIDHPAYHRDVY